MNNEIHVSTMVSQLVEAKIPVTEIAAKVGVAQSTISRIHCERVDCRYSHFIKIRNLWEERIGINSVLPANNVSV